MSVTRPVEWGVLLGMGKVETVEQMPEEYRQVVMKLLYALASTEFASVEQHQPWINQGPTPEDRYIQAQVAADEFHASFGARRVRDLVSDAEYQRLSRAGRDEVQAAIDTWYPRALDTFGKSASRFSDLAVAYGVRRWGNGELRTMYQTDIDEQIRSLGLVVPPEDRGRKIF